jgi:SAM-dependent methyltransferase
MRTLIRFDDIPVYQNKMYETRAAALLCPRGDMHLVQDDDTGLIFNAAYDGSLLSYDESYQNEQSHSPAFRSHLDAVIALIEPHFRGLGIVEIGCGKGAFLELLRARGHDAIGIDPAYEGDADYIVKDRFSADLGLQRDAVVLRHTLEHIPDPLRFLAAIRDANRGRGLIYIEVPCFDWIVRHRAWFDIFYEHVNYFRLGDFARMFGRVVDAGRVFGGQYLYAVADLSSWRGDRIAGGAEPASLPDGFLDGIDAALRRPRGGGKRAIWGAAAKGVMFAHHAGARGARLDFAIDINPGKQRRFLAGSGLPVLAPAEALPQLAAGDEIFVMNSNYLPEIMATAGDRPTYICVDRT